MSRESVADSARCMLAASCCCLSSTTLARPAGQLCFRAAYGVLHPLHLFLTHYLLHFLHVTAVAAVACWSLARRHGLPSWPICLMRWRGSCAWQRQPRCCGWRGVMTAGWVLAATACWRWSCRTTRPACAACLRPSCTSWSATSTWVCFDAAAAVQHCLLLAMQDGTGSKLLMRGTAPALALSGGVPALLNSYHAVNAAVGVPLRAVHAVRLALCAYVSLTELGTVHPAVAALHAPAGSQVCGHASPSRCGP